jgi:hypothetical protein
MSFANCQEIAAESRAGRRKVVAGEGMLVVRKSFTWQGERYKAGVTRVSPQHAVCDSEYADLLKPAYERESSPAVLRFLERLLVERSRLARRRRGRGAQPDRQSGRPWSVGERWPD